MDDSALDPYLPSGKGSMSWFYALTAFDESNWDHTRSLLAVDGVRLSSLVNGKSWAIGTLEIPSLADLRRRSRSGRLSGGDCLRVRNLSADVRSLHAEATSAGAVFQVASQFNLLEMIHPGVTPERGVGIYQNDPTQGPACAIAAGPATIYRNYFAETGTGAGQTADRQINALHDLAAALTPNGIPMRNGYAWPTIETLTDIAAFLHSCDTAQVERIRGLLRVGVHRDVEVTQPGPGCGQLVTQVFCSALPVSYSRLEPADWEPFARLVLEAAYEATLWTAVDNAARGGTKTAFLTMLGGGAFGNAKAWILDAIERALNIFRPYELEVCIVSYGRVPPELERLEASFSGTGTMGG